MSDGAFSPVTSAQGSESHSKVTELPSQGAQVPSIRIDVSCDDRPNGGDQTALAPKYELHVRNPPTPAIDASCLWQDDNGILVQENDNDTICIDNA